MKPGTPDKVVIKITPEDLNDGTHGKVLQLCINLNQQISLINAKLDDLITRVDRIEKNQQILSHGHARILKNQGLLAQPMPVNVTATTQVSQQQEKPSQNEEGSSEDDQDDAPASPRIYEPH